MKFLAKIHLEKNDALEKIPYLGELGKLKPGVIKCISFHEKLKILNKIVSEL